MKKVLLIGDSIRLGYCQYVKNELNDIAEIFYPNENCQYTQNTFVHLADWLALAGNPSDIDLVHWNNGHWDCAHWGKTEESLNSPEQYAEMLERIYRRLTLACPHAKIIFALTTPMNPDNLPCPNPRSNAEIGLYNTVAAKTIKKLGGTVNDLYSIMKDKPASFYIDHAHFTEDGYKLLAQTVAKLIRSNL